MGTIGRAISGETILNAAKQEGLKNPALISVEKLITRLDGIAWFPVTEQGSAVLLPAFMKAIPDPYSGQFLVCALPYVCDEPGDALVPDDPHGLIAAFARRDYYRAAVKRLQKVIGLITLRTGLPKNTFRIFVNSRIPEKLIAYGARLGNYAKNSLVYTKGYGSQVVLALLYLPFRSEEKTDDAIYQSPAEFCGSCNLCVSACPTNALGGQDMAHLPRCLKTLSDKLDVWDEKTRLAWGDRLYGCDVCQTVCSKNKDRLPAVAVKEGELGPGISLLSLLSLDGEAVKEKFKKTALGMSWILPHALLRNALCAAGNTRCRALLSVIKKYLHHPVPALADMAAWAMQRIDPD